MASAADANGLLSVKEITNHFPFLLYSSFSMEVEMESESVIMCYYDYDRVESSTDKRPRVPRGKTWPHNLPSDSAATQSVVRVTSSFSFFVCLCAQMPPSSKELLVQITASSVIALALFVLAAIPLNLPFP